MNHNERMQWGYRLNQLTGWNTTLSELVERAREWGFEDHEARPLAEVAFYMTRDDLEQYENRLDRQLGQG